MLFSLWPWFVSTFLALVVWFDLKERRVSNKLLLVATGSQLVLFGVAAFLQPPPPEFPSFSNAGIGFCAGFVLFFPLWLARVMGAGDVKFIAVLGLLMGWQAAGIAVLLGGIPSAGYALRVSWQQWRAARTQPRPVVRGVPYAGYIALGALIWLWWR